MKLLALVKKLYKESGDKDFVAGVQEIVRKDILFCHHNNRKESTTLEKISSYLSLDYDLDSRDFADYSFIEDESIKATLLSDFREMLRYQYGTRSHKVDFAEFCRYAVMQIEMLVNYYFEKKYDSNLEDVITAILLTNPKFKRWDQLSQISDIPLKTKVYHIRHELNWDKALLSNILNAIEVRNNQSHRSLRVKKDLIQDYVKLFKEKKVWHQGLGIPFYKQVIEQGVVTQKELDDYNFQVWLDKQPFYDITLSLKLFAEQVSSSLHSPPHSSNP